MRPIEIFDHGRGPALKGTRLTVYDILPYHLAGRSPTYIAAVFGISTPEVRALLDYIASHRDEVMAVHYKIEERHARGNPPEMQELLRASEGAAQRRLDELRRRKAEVNGESHPG